MTDLVDKYTKDFPVHEPTGRVTPQGYAVLITGTTGAIGSNTLAELYKSPSVTKIVVLARRSTVPIFVRQKKALEDRGLDSSIVDSSKIALLEGDPALLGFGLGDDVISELKSNITHILHIGRWKGTFDILELTHDPSLRLESGFQLGSFDIRAERRKCSKPDQLRARIQTTDPPLFYLRQYCSCRCP